MHFKQLLLKILASLSIIVFISLITVNSLLTYSLSWSGPHPIEFESDDLEYLDHYKLQPLQIIKTDSEYYCAIFTGLTPSYYDGEYIFGKSTDLGEWTNFTKIQYIVQGYSVYSGDPKHLAQLDNGKIQLTIAEKYSGYIKIKYRTSLNGEVWEQLKEADLSLSQANILDFDLYWGDILVFEDGIDTKYLLVEDSYDDNADEKRLVLGYIEESNETFIIEQIEYLTPYIRFRDIIIWNDRPTILYRYHGDDVDNRYKLGIAVYNNSQWNYFETIDLEAYEHLKLAEHEGTLYVYHRDARDYLQISEINFRYQEMSWQKSSSKTISAFDNWLYVRIVENSDKKEIVVIEYHKGLGYYVEEFDINQLSTYMVNISLFLLVLVVPIILHKIKERRKKEAAKL